MSPYCHLQLNLQTTQRRAELKKGFIGYTLYNKLAFRRRTLIGTELTGGYRRRLRLAPTFDTNTFLL
jgi:hypothetical protein